LIILNKGDYLKEKNIKKLKVIKDKRGYLFEVLRKDDEIFKGKFGQILVSASKPGITRAWHMHKKQADFVCCIKGKIKFATAEEKKRKKTEIKKYFLGGKNLVLVKIPPKVWHGYKVLGKKEAIVLYVMDEVYNPVKPDEERKAFDAFGKEIWK
jgi:dTDP-4-dehydrorhamnose 3,5-epimerase